MVGPSECAGPARPVPLACQCRWLGLCREPEPMGNQGVWYPQAAWYPGYPQVPRYPTAANGPLTDR